MNKSLTLWKGHNCQDTLLCVSSARQHLRISISTLPDTLSGGLLHHNYHRRLLKGETPRVSLQVQQNICLLHAISRRMIQNSADICHPNKNGYHLECLSFSYFVFYVFTIKQTNKRVDRLTSYFLSCKPRLFWIRA